MKSKRILVIKPSSLGDIIHTFPAVTALKKEFPDSVIDWLVNPEFSEIVAMCPAVDNCIPFERKKLGSFSKFLSEILKLKKSLSASYYDFIIDFQGLMRSSMVTKLADAGRIYGFAKPREQVSTFFYTDRVAVSDKAKHAIEKNMELVGAVIGRKAELPENYLLIPDELKSRLAEILKRENISQDDYKIGMVIGARWESKKWPDEFFVSVCDELGRLNSDSKIILIGAPSDSENSSFILEHSENGSLVSLVGKTSMTELLVLIDACDVILTNDSGPMHIAAALDKRTIAMFGPTDPEKTGPFGDNSLVLSAENLDCLKCLKRVCPAGTNDCHKNIDPVRVAELLTENYQTGE